MVGKPRRSLEIKYKMEPRKKLHSEDTICEVHRRMWCMVADHLSKTEQKQLREELLDLIERAYDFGKRMSDKLDKIREEKHGV